MQLFNNSKIDFISKKKIGWSFSAIINLLGIASLIMNGGPNLSIDFTGGTVIQMKFDS